MSNKVYDNKFFIGAICIMFGLCFITLIITFIQCDRLRKEKNTLQTEKEESSSLSQNLDYKLVRQILDTIEDYYLVNKQDTKLIKTIKIQKSKIDTITINNGKQNRNP